MREIDIQNPFVVGKYVSDKYFCDRSDETVFLRKQIENGRNVALISPRRMGKTGLIHHFFNQPQIKDHYHLFFVDIYSTTSLTEFVYVLGKEIYERLKSKSTRWKERFFQIISSFRVGFKLDAQTGAPTFDIGLGDITSPQTTLDEIFRYIDEADKPCIIAIDEFQQIGNYHEKNVEALLRTKIQQCVKAQFVFSGSKRHIMSNMFHSSAKPFYQSAISMSLAPIPVDTYCAFVQRLFEERGKYLDRDVISIVWNKYEGCTWFVQMMMNELFALTSSDAVCGTEMVEKATQNVVMMQEDSYMNLMSQVPQKQKLVLQAIAKEGVAKNMTSAKFIQKHNLVSASSVQAALKLLMHNDLVTRDERGYRIYDYFFSQWLATRY